MDSVSEQACFVIIKADAIERGLVGRIISRLEDTHMHLMAYQERHKSRAWAEQHYAHLAKEPFFDQLAQFMTMRPLVSVNVIGVDSINRIRKIVGPTDSRLAPPGTIRGDWGTYPVMYNLIHVSDSEEAADRERALWYDLSTDIVKKVQTKEG